MATKTLNLGNSSNLVDTKIYGDLYFPAGKSIQTIGTKATNSMIRFLDNTSDAYGNGISIGGGGVVVVGAGESAGSFSVAAGTETLYLLADGTVNIEANGDTIGNRVGIQVTTAGNLIPIKADAATNNAQSLGTSGVRWSKLFVGSADSYGNSTTPIYWNAGVPTAITSYGGNAATATIANKLATFKQGSTTETYGTSYPLYAQWRDNTHLHLKCDNYTTEIDYADSAAALTSNAGSNTQAVYFSGGKPVAATGTLTNSISGNAATATNADTLDGRHGTGYMQSNGNDTSLGSSGPAATAKEYFLNTSKIPNSNMTCVYNNSGTEWAHIFSRTGNYGSIIKWSYTDTYMRILRYYNGTWKTDDWEKMSAGYADSAGNADTLDGYHASSFSQTSHTHSYLPLSGGTMTGRLCFSATAPLQYNWAGATEAPMIILKDSESYGIRYQEGSPDTMKFSASGNANTNNADLCINGAGDGTVTIRGNTILHSGNYNSYSPTKTGGGASGTWGINITGNATTVTNGVYVFGRAAVGTAPAFDNPGFNGLFEIRSSSETPSQTGTKPYDGFGPCLTMKTPDNIAILQIAGLSGGQFWMRAKQAANVTLAGESWYRLWRQGDSVTGAVWNDYAEYREVSTEQPGRCVYEVGDDSLALTTKRLQKGCSITSDTWGFAQGKTEKAQTPIAVSGRVLAYPLEDREEFKQHIGDVVCSGPNGTVSIMTDEEVQKYPLAIVGTISAVPDYEEWGGGENADRDSVKVDGRIWIRIR